MVNALLTPGLTGNVSVNLVAEGNENAIGFSLSFDPSQFAFVGASPGTASSGADLNLNMNEVEMGYVAAVLALPAGTTFSAGTNEVLRLRLQPAASAFGSYVVALINDVVPLETSDAAANTLDTTYLNGTITINPVPTLRIFQSGANVILAWPAWASDFKLQQVTNGLSPIGFWSNLSITPTTNNGENTITMPLSGDGSFYRLYKP